MSALRIHTEITCYVAALRRRLSTSAPYGADDMVNRHDLRALANAVERVQQAHSLGEHGVCAACHPGYANVSDEMATHGCMTIARIYGALFQTPTTQASSN